MGRGVDPQNHLESEFDGAELLKNPAGLGIMSLSMQKAPEPLTMAPKPNLPLPTSYNKGKKMAQWSKTAKQ